MRNPEMGMKYDPYKNDIPNQGERFEEDGKMVYWNCANQGDSVETVMSKDRGNGPKPLDAKEIDTPKGKMVIVKWEAKKE